MKFIETRSYNVINNGKPDIWSYGTPAITLSSDNHYVAIKDIEGAKELKDLS